jgi:peptidylprolyl isomerase
VESENQKKKLAIEEQSKKKVRREIYVRQDKMKYFNALQRKATKHLPDLNTLSLKKRMAKNRLKAQHYSSIMQVF